VNEQESFSSRGIPFSFLVVLHQGILGTAPEPDEAAQYAQDIGDPPYPVTASIDQAIVDATPWDGKALPGKCVLSSDMVLLDCWTGHGDFEAAFDLIEAHARAAD
jgi:hypothetical protein